MPAGISGSLPFPLFLFVKRIGRAALRTFAGLAPSFFLFAAFFADEFRHSRQLLYLDFLHWGHSP
jgi:hypothetical protein